MDCIFPGNLALSRALGDFVFKRNLKKPPEEQIVTGLCPSWGDHWSFIGYKVRSLASHLLSVSTDSVLFTIIPAACPDVVTKPITPDHEFMILACDGIWDVLTNEEVVEFIRARIAQRMEPEIVSSTVVYLNKLLLENILQSRV